MRSDVDKIDELLIGDALGDCGVPGVPATINGRSFESDSDEVLTLPNPVTDKLTIRIEILEAGVTIQIYNS